MKKINIVIVSLLFIGGNRLLWSAPIDLQIGARPAGMGGAFVAVADDVNAVYWNPAGLGQPNKAQISFTHTNPFGLTDVNLDWMAFSQPIGKRGGMGVGWLHKGATLEEENNQITTSRMTENTYILSVTIPISWSTLTGINFKRITLESLEETPGGGFGFDVGTLYIIDNLSLEFMDSFSVGVLFRNLTTTVKDESFPSTIRIGTAAKLFSEKWLIAGDLTTKEDVNKEKGTSYQSHIGCEYKITPNIFLRTGVDNGAFCGGAGLKFSNWQVDYAFVGDQEYELGSSYRISASLYF